MKWYVKLLKKEDANIFIAYSYEKNSSCDGVLRYDKNKEDISIEKMSDGASKTATEMVFGNIHILLEKNEITENRKCICIG